MTDLFQDLGDVKVDYSQVSDDCEGIAVLNQDLSDLEVARLSGAMAGSLVRVGTDSLLVSGEDEKTIIEVPTIKLMVENTKYLASPMERHIIESNTDGSLAVLVLDNSLFKLSESARGKKIAACSVAYQIHEAKKLGFTKIQTFAAGRPGSEYTGWKVWPKMGYDGVVDEQILGKIPPDHLARLKAGGNEPITVQRILDVCGISLWEQCGEAMPMFIDLINLNIRATSLMRSYVVDRRKEMAP